VAQKLVCDGLVTSLELEESGETDLFCESYAYGKMTRLPISKVQEGERAKVFCEEVHSNIWGPARVETKKGWCYYVTFINDYSVTNFIQSYLHQIFDDSHGLKASLKPLRRPFD